MIDSYLENFNLMDEYINFMGRSVDIRTITETEMTPIRKEYLFRTIVYQKY